MSSHRTLGEGPRCRAGFSARSPSGPRASESDRARRRARRFSPAAAASRVCGVHGPVGPEVPRRGGRVPAPDRRAARHVAPDRVEARRTVVGARAPHAGRARDAGAPPRDARAVPRPEVSPRAVGAAHTSGSSGCAPTGSASRAPSHVRSGPIRSRGRRAGAGDDDHRRGGRSGRSGRGPRGVTRAHRVGVGAVRRGRRFRGATKDAALALGAETASSSSVS